MLFTMEEFQTLRVKSVEKTDLHTCVLNPKQAGVSESLIRREGWGGGANGP